MSSTGSSDNGSDNDSGCIHDVTTPLALLPPADLRELEAHPSNRLKVDDMPQPGSYWGFHMAYHADGEEPLHCVSVSDTCVVGEGPSYEEAYEEAAIKSRVWMGAYQEAGDPPKQASSRGPAAASFVEYYREQLEEDEAEGWSVRIRVVQVQVVEAQVVEAQVAL